MDINDCSDQSATSAKLFTSNRRPPTPTVNFHIRRSGSFGTKRPCSSRRSRGDDISDDNPDDSCRPTTPTTAGKWSYRSWSRVPPVPGSVEALPGPDCPSLAAILVSRAVVVVNATPLRGEPDGRALTTTNGTGQMVKGSSALMRPGQVVGCARSQWPGT